MYNFNKPFKYANLNHGPNQNESIIKTKLNFWIVNINNVHKFWFDFFLYPTFSNFNKIESEIILSCIEGNEVRNLISNLIKKFKKEIK